jgi:hypothetical protein
VYVLDMLLVAYICFVLIGLDFVATVLNICAY